MSAPSAFCAATDDSGVSSTCRGSRLQVWSVSGVSLLVFSCLLVSSFLFLFLAKTKQFFLPEHLFIYFPHPHAERIAEALTHFSPNTPSCSGEQPRHCAREGRRLSSAGQSLRV